MAALLDPLKVLTHPACAPRLIAGEVRDIVPVGVVRVNQDHGVMRGAAAERPGARVKYATPFGRVLVVSFLTLFVCVMPHKKIPLHERIFRCKGMKGRNLVVFGEPRASARDRISTSFE